ncbi:DUF2288 domain-containing protein [Balneatrix alpica]|uniref:DUF2288 domain-containing protein n=1 Tax=Balneatrix alpica TaxID=75684 RepID=A0ABV5ZFH3_9GAMM|nr:DUF2288 domain-containing protein [Balneatrix alpica]
MTDTSPLSSADQQLLRAKLNTETARIHWQELQRYFAAGKLISVAAELDLIEVAYQLASDNAAQLQQWLAAGLVQRVQDDQASQWQADEQEFWAVVVRPWVVIQPMKKEAH